MHPTVTAEAPWLPDNIELACRLIPEVHGIKPLVQPCFRLLVRRLNYRNVREHFRVGVDRLQEQLHQTTGRLFCTKTISRYLSWLKREGWITREQTRIQNRDGSYPQAWTGLTDKALIALGLLSPTAKTPVSQEQPSSPEVPQVPDVGETPLACSPKLSPTGTGKPLRGWKRTPRIPTGLEALKARIGAVRCCWLMGLCKAQGVRLQDYAVAFLAEDPVGWIRNQLRKLAQPGWWVSKMGAGASEGTGSAGNTHTANAGAYRVYEAPTQTPAEKASGAQRARSLRQQWGLGGVFG